MHTKNSPVLPKPKCKTCHEHQGHNHCQGDPAHGAVMICTQDTHRCPHKPTHCFTISVLFLCYWSVTSASLSSLFLLSSLLHLTSSFPMSLGFSFSTPIFFILFLFLLGLEFLESPIFHLALLVCLRTTYSHPSGAPVLPHPSRG